MKTVNHSYTPEEVEFIKKHVLGLSSKELTEIFNARFGLSLTLSQIKSFKKNRKLRSGLSGKAHFYTPEEIEFLKEHVRGRSNRELTDMVNAHFGLSLSPQQIKDFKIHRKLRSGLSGGQTTRFKKGYRPWNYRPVGAERVDTGGYVEIKIAAPDKWKPKGTAIWEAANGPVPPGHTVIFGDGNKRNFELENLILVTMGQLGRLNKYHLIQNNADLTKTGILIADIRGKIGERKRVCQKSDEQK